MANRVLTPVTELDFDGIKQTSRYLSTTTEFRDSITRFGINIYWMSLHTTHIHRNVCQHACSRVFLDSAVLRKSIVSLAKNLGYVPVRGMPHSNSDDQFW